MDPKRQAILQLISQDPAYENHFFKTKKNPVWFFELKKRGYFDPKKNPSIRPADREGYYVIPQWNVLEYLERLSEQVNVPENEKYIDELLEIIKNVSTYKNENGEIIDNYRTWWFFIKILLKLPKDKIPVEILNLVSVWLKSNYGGSLVDADIATKLLPKFLYEGASEEDIKKAEKLVGYLTDFTWIKTKGILTEEEYKPEGKVEDHWLIDTFIKNDRARLVGKLCSVEILYNLANKLKAIVRKEIRTNWVEREENNDVYRFSANSEADDKFACSIGVYPKNVEGEEKELLEKFTIKPKALLEFSIEAINEEAFLSAVQDAIKDFDLPESVKGEIINKSEGLYKYLFQDYSYIWLRDLSSLIDSRLHDIRHILLAILTEAFVEKARNNIPSIREVIKNFLSKSFPYPLFRRQVLIAIAKNWNNYKDIFWDILLPNTEIPLLEEPSFEQDMRYLFRENVGKFTDEEKEKIKGFIEDGPQKYLPSDNKEKYIIYWKQRWYGALKDDPFFSIPYQEIKASSNFNDKEEDDTESKWIAIPESSFSTDQMLKTSNAEIATYLFEFKEKDRWEERNSEALAKALEEAVKNKPEKFADDMDPFINTGFYYVDHILDGFKGAWINKSSFNWNKVISFIEKYIDRPEFWNNKLKVPSGFYDADNKWIIGAIGELIEEGTRNDEWSISEEHSPILKRILLTIAKNASKDEKDSNSFPSHVLNCGLGKVITGLIYLTLRIARIKKNESEAVWDKELKEIFETFLSRNVYDAHTILGEYLISFAYLDKEWTEKQITILRKTKDKVAWEAFMSGCLTASRVNLDLYKLMKSHYIKGLTYSFDEKILNERLIDHVGIGYLNGVEEINGDGILGILWKKWNSTQIIALIDYFWTQRDSLIDKDNEPELNAQMRTRIIQFWRDIFEKYCRLETLTKNDKDILSEITKLIVFLSEIDEEIFKWLMFSAPYVQAHYSSSYLLERLNILKDKGEVLVTANRVATIFLEILKSFKPDYDPSDIRSIVEHLFQLNNSETTKLANTICDEYAKSGIEIVSDIYSQFN